MRLTAALDRMSTAVTAAHMSNAGPSDVGAFQVEIESFAERAPASVLARAAYDPDRTRILR